MKPYLMLPYKYKKIGWFIFIPATLFSITLLLSGFGDFEINTKVFAIYSQELMGETQWMKMVQTNISNTIAGLGFIIGALLIAFSREQKEDEFIAQLRLSSLQWAVLLNYVLLLLSFLLIYGMGFLNVMLYNMFTVIILFIVRFNYVLYRHTKSISDEK
jgi:hypothetical protein